VYDASPAALASTVRGLPAHAGIVGGGLVAMQGTDAAGKPCVWVGRDAGAAAVFLQLPAELSGAVAQRTHAALAARITRAGTLVLPPRADAPSASPASKPAAAEARKAAVFACPPAVAEHVCRYTAEPTAEMLAALAKTRASSADGATARAVPARGASAPSPETRGAAPAAAAAAHADAATPRASSAPPPPAAAARPAADKVVVPPGCLLPLCLARLPVPVPSRTKLADMTRALYGAMVREQPALKPLRLSFRHQLRLGQAAAAQELQAAGLSPTAPGGGELLLLQAFVVEGDATTAKTPGAAERQLAAEAARVLAGLRAFVLTSLSTADAPVSVTCEAVEPTLLGRLAATAVVKAGAASE
jgi:hypothetical protein